MKIFFIPTSYPSSSNPTKNIFIYEQAKQLASMGHDITILHVNKLPTRFLFRGKSSIVTKFNDGFANRYSIDQRTFLEDKFPLLNKHYFINNMQKLFSSAINEVGLPDVLYAHFSMWAGYAGCIISQKYNVPIVVLEHYSKLSKHNKSRVLVSCVKEVIEKSTIFACVSYGLKTSIINSIDVDKKLYVVPNMVDSSFIYVPRTVKEEFIFSSIGRLSEPKNYKLLIEAFINSFCSSDNVKLRIGGDGELKNELVSLVKKAKREHQILFLGNLTRKETINEYINCDCFVLASNHETYGIVYREALATGRPIITTNHGGFDESNWHKEYGIMIPKNDSHKLSNAMKFMRNNINNYNLSEISDICLNDCSADLVGSKIEKLLYTAKGAYNV